MSGSFSADWLTLREPFDRAARDVGLAEKLAAWSAQREALDVVDLGSGTGSMRRWLAPRLHVAQRWRLVERDRALIAVGKQQLDAAEAGYVQADLVADLESLVLPSTGLVTASALVDLVSEAWAKRLARAVVRAGAALYLTLTYDGAIDLDPADGFDLAVTSLVNRHQTQDKGFGPALGPRAHAGFLNLLEPASGTLLTASSPWVIEAGGLAMQRALIEGWAAAAVETESDAQADIRAWQGRRLAVVDVARRACASAMETFYGCRGGYRPP
ncbi:MAG: class I SAM-dependent methyltransferase [Sphingomonadales bacterium]|nr:class I SAM-dependent methyltransferase [Sphingomonadales bacterium]